VGGGLRVLLVEDDSTVREMMSEFLLSLGYGLRVAPDGAAALELFAQEPAEIVVTDVQLPGIDGLEVLSRIKKSAPETCVVVMTGFGSEDTAIRAMRCGASNYFKKPISLAEFGYALGVLADLARSNRVRRADPRFLEQETRTLRFGNDLEAIYPVIRDLTATAETFPFDVEAVRVALLEMLTNAIEHGNLGIGREQKQAALRAGTLRDLYARRAAEVPARGRTVRVAYEFTPERFACRITDDGGGFAWRSLPEASDPDQLFSGSGRGIIVTRLLMDEVVYNDRGNEVLLVKRARGADPCAAADPVR
jgi:DNA-binding response OmpR family regulator